MTSINVRTAPEVRQITQAEAYQRVLRKKFTPEQVDFRIAPGGSDKFVKVLTYIDARDVVNRLNEVDPRWQSNFTVVVDQLESDKQRRVAVQCMISIDSIPRSDIGEALGFRTDPHLVKTAYSDALKRAAVNFGVAADLYELGDTYLWFKKRDGNETGFLKKNAKGKFFITDKGYEECRREYIKQNYPLYEWQRNELLVHAQDAGIEPKDIPKIAKEIGAHTKYPEAGSPINAWTYDDIILHLDKQTKELS